MHWDAREGDLGMGTTQNIMNALAGCCGYLVNEAIVYRNGWRLASIKALECVSGLLRAIIVVAGYAARIEYYVEIEMRLLGISSSIYCRQTMDLGGIGIMSRGGAGGDLEMRKTEKQTRIVYLIIIVVCLQRL